MTPEEIEEWAANYEKPTTPIRGSKLVPPSKLALRKAAFIRSAAKGQPERHGFTDERLAVWIKDLEDLSDWHHGKTRFGHAAECDRLAAFLKAAVEKLT